MYEYIESETLTIFFDTLLIISVAGLWVLWWKQFQQRKNIESMLTEASTQLQEATLMLDQALVQIQDLKSEDVQKDRVSITSSPVKSRVKKETLEKRREQRVQIQKRAQEKQPSTTSVSHVAQILRLQREGFKPEKIAEKLRMPLAQIKLMQMLQTSPNS